MTAGQEIKPRPHLNESEAGSDLVLKGTLLLLL